MNISLASNISSIEPSKIGVFKVIHNALWISTSILVHTVGQSFMCSMAVYHQTLHQIKQRFDAHIFKY